MEQDLDIKKEEPSYRSTAAAKGPKVWVVGSGKGGVGKTFVASSLAITLSKLGHTVTVVDMDSTGANIHTAFGMNPSHVGLRNFFEGSRSLKECLTTTPLLSVSIVQGFWDTWIPTEVTRTQMVRLMEECRTLNCDYVIIDLSAGAQEGHLELFNRADERIVLTSPEPTSIEKTYRFLEALLCYGLKQNSIPEVYSKLISELREYRIQGMSKNFSFRQFLALNEGLHRGYFDEFGQAPLRLLLNSCRSQANHQLGYSIQSVTRKYYDLSLDFLGSLDYDNAVCAGALSHNKSV